MSSGYSSLLHLGSVCGKRPFAPLLISLAATNPRVLHHQKGSTALVAWIDQDFSHRLLGILSSLSRALRKPFLGFGQFPVPLYCDASPQRFRPYYCRSSPPTKDLNSTTNSFIFS